MQYVLESLTIDNSKSNPYITQLLSSIRDHGINTFFWSWKKALFGAPSAVHVHWPETLYTGRTRWRSYAKSLMFLALLAKCKVLKIPVIWTVHNLTPHESVTRTQRMVDGLFRRTVSDVILLNDSPVIVSGLAKGVARHTILHGDYKDWFGHYEKKDSRPGWFCCVGMLRPYKGIEQLIDAFTNTPGADLRLIIAGQPNTSNYGETLRKKASLDSRIVLIFRFLDDEEIVGVITQSQAVILPYKTMYNSGVSLLALSLDRPVILPESESSLALAEEVGSGWVLPFKGDFTADAFGEALATTVSPPSFSPDLRARDWHSIGFRHAAIYRQGMQS